MKDVPLQKSGLEDESDLEKAVEHIQDTGSYRKPTKSVRRVGAAVEFYDGDNNFQGAMRAEDFASLQETFKK